MPGAATKEGFRLVPDGPDSWVVEVRNGSQWQSVVGDIDVMSITKADGTPLTDEAHLRILEILKDSPLELQHPESGSWWNGTIPTGAREGYLRNGGQCCFAQFAPDGIVREVQYNPRFSDFTNPENYYIWYDGGYYTSIK